MVRIDTDDGTDTIRYRCNVQLGDGPDQRGDITVEIQRELNGEPPDQEFADFATEVDRVTDLLRDQLGLPEDDHDE